MDGKDWLRWAAEKFDEAEREEEEERSDRCSRAERDRCSITTTTTSSSSSASSVSSRSSNGDGDEDDDDNVESLFMFEALPSQDLTDRASRPELDTPELEERVLRIHTAAQRMSSLDEAASRAEQAATDARDAESKAIAKHDALKKALAMAWRDMQKASSRARAAESSAGETAHRAKCATEVFDDVLSEIHDVEVLLALGIA
jgi:hypothetical protein